MTERKRVKLQDLTPNRDMIDVKFDGYKLSLDAIPLCDVLLPGPVGNVLPSNSQWSYQHILLFGRHNALYQDLWHRDQRIMAFISQDLTIYDCRLCNFDGRPDGLEIVEVGRLRAEPEECVAKEMRVNASLSFCSADMVLVSNGLGCLYLFRTGDRVQRKPWTELAKFPLRKPNECAFSIVGSKTGPDGHCINCLLQSVEDTEESEEKALKEEKSFKFKNVLLWLTLTMASDGWEVTRTRKLTCDQGVLDYAALNSDSTAVCVISSKPMRFEYDSKKPVEELEANKVPTLDATLPEYLWSQSDSELMIMIPNAVPEHLGENDVFIDFSTSDLHVEVKGHRVLLDGKLSMEIDPAKSSWTLADGGRLQITLAKQNLGVQWSSLVSGVDHGQYRKDLATLIEVCERLEQFTSSEEVTVESLNRKHAFNTEQLEECDAVENTCAYLTWLDGDGHDVVHQADIGGCPWLFSVQVDPTKLPLFCLRHDVDGVLWRCNEDLFSADDVWVHQATFNAFGYVQAGNPNRKFCSCSPDFTYAVIADGNRRLHIYWQPTELDGTLVNRRTGVKVKNKSAQQLITLESSEEILGLVVQSDAAFVLTETKLHAAKFDPQIKE